MQEKKKVQITTTSLGSQPISTANNYNNRKKKEQVDLLPGIMQRRQQQSANTPVNQSLSQKRVNPILASLANRKKPTTPASNAWNNRQRQAMGSEAFNTMFGIKPPTPFEVTDIGGHGADRTNAIIRNLVAMKNNARAYEFAKHQQQQFQNYLNREAQVYGMEARANPLTARLAGKGGANARPMFDTSAKAQKDRLATVDAILASKSYYDGMEDDEKQRVRGRYIETGELPTQATPKSWWDSIGGDNYDISYGDTNQTTPQATSQVSQQDVNQTRPSYTERISHNGVKVVTDKNGKPYTFEKIH